MRKFIAKMLTLALVLSAMLGAFAGCTKEVDTRTVLRITSWNFGTVEQNVLKRRMIAEFEKLHTDYRVEIITPAGAYNDALMAMSATKNLPDVFDLTSMTFGLTNQMLLDITEMAEADEEWDNIPGSVKDSGRFNGRIYGIPGSMALQGLFVNEAALDHANLDLSDLEVDPVTKINPSVDAFVRMVKNSAFNVNNSVIALNTESSLLNWYPAAIDSTKKMGYYTWDEENKRYHIDSAEFEQALSLMQDINSLGASYDTLTAEQRTDYNLLESDDAGVAFRSGKIAMYYGATYQRKGLRYGQGDVDMLGESLRFVGNPGGRNIIIPDIWGISAATEHPEMAYELAKYLSFSEEGLKKAIEIDSDDNPEFVSLPLSTDEAILDAYFAREKTPGLREVLESLDEYSIIEAPKVVPGYSYVRGQVLTGRTYSYINANGEDVSRDNASLSDIYYDLWKFPSAVAFSWADVKTEINTLVNNEYENSVRRLNDLYPVS